MAVADVLACSFGGLPLNAPNDVAVEPHDGAVYFTDPYDGFLEVGRRPLGDANYSSDKSALGFAGVFRVPPPPRVGSADAARPQLISAALERPNGIGFEPVAAESGQHALWVSDCCQGHAASCPPATARWHRFVPTDEHRSNYTRQRTVEWARPGGGAGCADGFKIFARPGKSPILIGACPLGVCVLDTARTDHPVFEYVDLHHRTTSVALGGDGHLYVTGEGHLWSLILAADAFEPPSPAPAEEHWAHAFRDEL